MNIMKSLASAGCSDGRVGAYSLNSTFAQIMESPEAITIVRQCLPEIVDSPVMGFVRGKTLNEMLAMAPQHRKQIEAMLVMLNQ